MLKTVYLGPYSIVVGGFLAKNGVCVGGLWNQKVPRDRDSISSQPSAPIPQHPWVSWINKVV